ncbi:MAG: response regulator [Frankiaceae bacterium]
MDEASSADPPGDGGARGSVRVLVADDSAGMRALLCAQFESLHGVQLVGVAVDGAEAVDQAVRQVPDPLLLDIAMLTMDGLAATAEIRRRVPTAKVVVLSADSAEKTADPARAAGADAYLAKPAPTDELVALIQRLFPHARLADIGPAPHPVGAVAGTAAKALDARRHRLLVDAIDEGVLVVDADRRVLSADVAASRILAVPTRLATEPTGARVRLGALHRPPGHRGVRRPSRVDRAGAGTGRVRSGV